MYFLLTGEGSTDIGYSDENPGILLSALTALAAEVTDEDFRNSYHIVSRTDLSTLCRDIPNTPKSMLSRGAKKKYDGMNAIQRQAQALGKMAKEMDDSGAVFFHDCDYTHSQASDPQDYYEELVRTIETGFYLNDKYRDGVAMIPKPRSESWLLAHYQDTPYQSSERFENLPGNDTSPNSGKKVLAQFFNCNENEIYDPVNADERDWGKIDCPSFIFFKKRFQHVVQRLTHQSATIRENETLLSAYE